MLIRKKEEPLEDILMRAKVSRMREEHQRQVQELQSRVEELAARPPPAPAEARVTLDAKALEALSTVQSVALGKTLEALAQMLPGPPKFAPGETSAIPIPQLAKMIRSDAIVRGICFQVGGTGPANYLLILAEEDADRVVALMTGSPPG
ncbi:MAG: hypothetical protein HY558_08320, partial [Euryarchaeota archaeon]|nr:hypothetical protein [Euryarchaeota archaeon]